MDRDSGLLAGIGDERDPAVMKLMEMAIDACRKRGAYCGICGQVPSQCRPPRTPRAVIFLFVAALTMCARGFRALARVQAPSDFPELTKWLVRMGISSIALNADAVMQMARVVAEAEAELHVVTPA